MCAGLSVRMGIIMCFPHGRGSRDNQLGISRKGIFVLWDFFFFLTDPLYQETTFEQLPVFMFSLISINIP